jgi:hypothetical protein
VCSHAQPLRLGGGCYGLRACGPSQSSQIANLAASSPWPPSPHADSTPAHTTQPTRYSDSMFRTHLPHYYSSFSCSSTSPSSSTSQLYSSTLLLTPTPTLLLRRHAQSFPRPLLATPGILHSFDHSPPTLPLSPFGCASASHQAISLSREQDPTDHYQRVHRL